MKTLPRRLDTPELHARSLRNRAGNEALNKARGHIIAMEKQYGDRNRIQTVWFWHQVAGILS